MNTHSNYSSVDSRHSSRNKIMEIKDLKKVYCIGIKGAGMTALAEILKGRGIEVLGSDTHEIFYTDEILKRLQISYKEGFSYDNVPSSADLVVYSTAYKEENNEEMKAAKELKLQMLSYPEMLGKLFAEKLGIAVCGTHGKTTTSAMLAQAFVAAGKDPSAIIGSQVIFWQGSALSGKGEYFIAESDEYQNKLRFYQPWSVILTSVDWDHPDFFPDFQSYKQVFEEFVVKIPKTGNLVVWGDSSDTLEVAKNTSGKILTYGFGSDNKYRVRIIESEKTEIQEFEVFFKDESLGIFQTSLSGKHNILNATAVVALSHASGLDLEKVKKSLAEFMGTSRRFEMVGKFQDAILIDDYAHHPDEIKPTLNGAKKRFEGKRIWTVFHPHTFSRTQALLEDFAQSFDDTDKVIVIGTYGSARETSGGATSEDLVRLINKYNHDKAEYIENIDGAVEFLKEKEGEYDVLITMGAGDVWRVAEKLKQ